MQFPTDAGSANLAAEGAAVGLGPARLVSTALLPQDSHLSGKAAAHLYLDTFVYNGHTTAADALWAGVPMLTLPGAKQIGAFTAAERKEIVQQFYAKHDASKRSICGFMPRPACSMSSTVW